MTLCANSSPEVAEKQYYFRTYLPKYCPKRSMGCPPYFQDKQPRKRHYFAFRPKYYEARKYLKKNIQEGLNFAATHDCLLALGVQPTRAETAYGYIQKGSASTMGDIYKVKAFTEKPDAEFAQMFVDSNEWLWNTGMYLGNVKFLKESLQQSLSIAQIDFDATPQEFDTENEEEFAQHLFPAFPNMSIDYGVLEKSPNVHVLKCDFGG